MQNYLQNIKSTNALFAILLSIAISSEAADCRYEDIAMMHSAPEYGAIASITDNKTKSESHNVPYERQNFVKRTKVSHLRRFVFRNDDLSQNDSVVIDKVLGDRLGSGYAHSGTMTKAINLDKEDEWSYWDVDFYLEDTNSDVSDSSDRENLEYGNMSSDKKPEESKSSLPRVRKFIIYYSMLVPYDCEGYFIMRKNIFFIYQLYSGKFDVPRFLEKTSEYTDFRYTALYEDFFGFELPLTGDDRAPFWEFRLEDNGIRLMNRYMLYY